MKQWVDALTLLWANLKLIHNDTHPAQLLDLEKEPRRNI